MALKSQQNEEIEHQNMSKLTVLKVWEGFKKAF